jgi:uncharacterized membrane protein
MRLTLKTVSKMLLGLLFIAAGLNHFLNPALYKQIMPPYLPWHDALIYLSGIAEILFGVLLLIPTWTRVGAWGIILVLIAVFPVHIYMLLNAEQFPIPTFLLWLRLPFQAVLIAWAYWYTRKV